MCNWNLAKFRFSTLMNVSLTLVNLLQLFPRNNTFKYTIFIWGKVFKNGPSEICGIPPLKNLKAVFHKICFSRPYHFKFFKGCLQQISLGPFLNSRPYHFKFLKGCLPEISLGPFLNTLSQSCKQISRYLNHHPN